MTKPQRCTAHTKTGPQCRNWAIPGGNVCRLHGGRAPQVQAAARRRLQEAEAQRQAQLFATRRDIHPAEALIELVQWTAGEVEHWRQKVREIEEPQLTWGTTKETTKISDTTGHEEKTETNATPHIAYRMLTDASNRLATYASAALKAGVDERRIQLAERQGNLVQAAIRQILTNLNLTPDQQALIPTVVPAALRLIGTQENQ